MAFHQSTDLYILIRSNKHRDYIGEFCQGIIGAAADDHAGFLRGQLLDRIELSQKDLMVDGHIHISGICISQGVCIHHKGI